MEARLETVGTLAQAIGALIPLVIVIFFGLAIYRTGSFHVLLAKAWSLVSGSKSVSDPVVAEFLDRQHSLATFRFHSGVPSPSLDHVRRLLEWTSSTGIKVSEVAGCGEFFDQDKFSVRMEKVPSLKNHRRRGVVNLLSLVLIGLLGFWAFSMETAYVRFKDDGQGFVLGHDLARAYWHDVAVTKNSCASGQANQDVGQSGFTRKQTDSLCAFLKDQGSKSFVDTTVRSQQRALMYLSLALSLCFIASMSKLARTANARSLNRRLLALESNAKFETDSDRSG